MLSQSRAEQSKTVPVALTTMEQITTRRSFFIEVKVQIIKPSPN